MVGNKTRIIEEPRDRLILRTLEEQELSLLLSSELNHEVNRLKNIKKLIYSH